MAIERRDFLVLWAAACAAPGAVLSAPGAPVLGTWRAPDGSHHVGAPDGHASLPLPGRAHDLVATADATTVFVMARRPGAFLVRVDLGTWSVAGTARSPQARHVCGHAALSSDDRTLYVTENDYESGEGRIGVYDTGPPFMRLDDLPSYGIGPHDIFRWPGSDLLVVANGGIRRHPETGRAKLNLDTMSPSLALIDPADGSLLAEARPPADRRQASIRHLDIAANGLVAAGMQWEGEGPSPALVATWDGSAALSFADDLGRETLALGGYVGSVAFDRSGAVLAATSPRGGNVAFWEASGMRSLGTWPLPDVCGLCAGDSVRSFVVASGLGSALAIAPDSMTATPFGPDAAPSRAWDNHLVGV